MQASASRYRLAGLTVLLALLHACGAPKSSSTGGPGGGPAQTNRITADFTVESKNTGTAVVRMNLNDGQVLGESYRLDGGDYLRACMNGVCRNLAENDSVTSPDYIARFAFQPGVDYVVSFNRPQAQSAPNSRVSLPPAFTLVTPANNTQVTDGDTVMVEWSPTGAPARVVLYYDADCPLAGGSNLIGTGTLASDTNGDGREAISIDSLLNRLRSGTSTFSRCSIDITVRHELDGQLDPAFRGGTAIGLVSRKVNVDYVAR